MNKPMLPNLFCALILACGPCSILLVQDDIKATLLKDIIKDGNGLFSIDEYGVHATFDKNYKVKISAAAPVSLLNRGNFIRFYGAFSSSVSSTYLNQEGVKVSDDLLVILKDKPGDPVDISVLLP